jgi:hypothetical protein
MKLPPERCCASIPDMRIRHAIAALLLLSCSVSAQQKPQTQGQSQKRASQQLLYEGPLDLPCAKIMAMPSSDYIAQVVAIDDSRVDGQLRGIRRYGACYDARTDQLAATLAHKGTGPKKSALANLKDFQAGIDSFRAKTIADVEPPADPVKTAYAALYEKQFRYEFYKSYEQKTMKPPAAPRESKPAPGKTPKVTETKSSDAPAASAGANSADLPPAPTPKLADVPEGLAKTTPPSRPNSSPAAAAPTNQPAAEPGQKEIDPFTKAKNHFGELLGLLPEDNMHEVHSAFGKLFSGNPVSEDLRAEVYGYAIFLLERPSDPPYAPPPF